MAGNAVGDQSYGFSQSGQTDFNNRCDSLPDGVRSVLVGTISVRLARSERLQLTMIAPKLIGYLYGIGSDAVDKVSGPWADIATAMYALDDYLDNAEAEKNTVISTMCLLVKGLSEVYSAVPLADGARKIFEKGFFDTAEAALKELETRNSSDYQPSIENAAKAGHKIALLKSCAVLVLTADRQEVDEDILLPIEDIATAFQLVDDISDWWEDLQAGHYTPLLARARAFMSEHQIIWDTNSQAQGMAALVVSESLQEMLSLAAERLKKSIWFFSQSSDSLTVSVFFHSIVEKLCLLLKEVEELHRVIPQDSPLEQIFSEKKVEEKVNQIIRDIDIIIDVST